MFKYPAKQTTINEKLRLLIYRHREHFQAVQLPQEKEWVWNKLYRRMIQKDVTVIERKDQIQILNDNQPKSNVEKLIEEINNNNDETMEEKNKVTFNDRVEIFPIIQDHQL